MTAPTGPGQREAAVVEAMARAMHKEDPTAWACGWPCSRSNHYRRLAVAAYRATQDGGAEAAVRRVEALAKDLHIDARGMWLSAETHDSDTDEVVGDTYYEASKRITAALAPQAGDGAR